MSETLNDRDKELVAAATQAIKERYRNDWQEVGAAIRTRDGRVVTGVNLDAYVGRGAVCAEAVAIGRALTEKGDHGIETIVAVRHPKPDEPNREIAVVSPCGTCRRKRVTRSRSSNAAALSPTRRISACSAIARCCCRKSRAVTIVNTR